MGDGPGDLGAQVGGGLRQGLAQALLGIGCVGVVDGGQQRRGLVAVAVQQMGDPLQRPAALAGDPPGPPGQGVVARSAHQGQLLRDAGVGVGQGLAQGVVDGVGGHDPVGGQFAAGDRGQPRGDPGDRVLAGDLRGGGLRARLELGLEQGAQARVDADDVVAGDGLRQHGVGMLEDVVDVGGGGHGLGDVQVPGGVGGADDPVLGPGDDEQDRLLGAQEDPGLGVDGLLGDHDVNALGGQDLQSAGVGGQVLDVLGPHSGGVDGALGADLVGLAGGQVGDAGAVDVAALVGDEAGDLGAVGGQCPQADGGAHQVDDQAGVVDAGVEEADGAGQAAGVQ